MCNFKYISLKRDFRNCIEKGSLRLTLGLLKSEKLIKHNVISYEYTYEYCYEYKMEEGLCAKIQKKIIEFMKKEAGITTTSEIASNLNLSWNTAEKYLLELALEGKIERIKKVGVNIWVLKKRG